MRPNPDALSEPADLDQGVASQSVTSVTQTLDKLPDKFLGVNQSEALAPAPQKDDKTVGTTQSTSSEAHKSSGLPQLDMQHWGGQIIWLLLIFLVFYLLMARVFVPRLRGVIALRGSTIAEDLANARAIRDEAEAQAKLAAKDIAEAHAAARKLAANAKIRIEADFNADVAAEDAKLQSVLNQADRRIKASRDEGLMHVQAIAQETASAIMEKLTGKIVAKTGLNTTLDKA
jgi:F-type H+-transporting ATPase subunit b